MLLRRAELGAGIAAAVLALAALLWLLLAPLYRRCAADVTFSRVCPPAAVRYESLRQAGLGADAWAFVLGLCVVLLIGAAGAYADARLAWPRGLIALWAAAVLAFAGCGVAAGGVVGLSELPAVLALCLAAYLSLLRRLQARRQVTQAEAAQRSASDFPPDSPPSS